MKKTTYLIFGGILVAFAIFELILLAMIQRSGALTIEQYGSIGDSFGILTSLFTALAFAGLILTILLQRKELSETRSIFRRQRFDDAFFRLLSFYRQNLNDISIYDSISAEDYSGVDALSFLLKKFTTKTQTFIHHLNNGEEHKIYVYHLFRDAQSIFIRQARYLGTLESVFSLIRNEIGESDDRALYWNIIASQLTSAELRYVFYCCLTAPKNDNLRNLVHEAGLFEARLSSMNISKAHIEIYNSIHGTQLEKTKRELILPYQTKEIGKIKKKLRKETKRKQRRDGNRA